jgi:hypothetical protein
MISPQRSPLERNPEAWTLLLAYGAGQDKATDGWLDRLSDVIGLENGELSRLHGKLIALGMLDFQLSDRTGGMRYQVTAEGQQSIKANAAQGHASEEADAA